MESFWVSFNAVAPLLLLVALGFYLNQKGLLAGEVLATINYLCFHLFLPFLLYTNIIHNDVKKLLNPRLFFFCRRNGTVYLYYYKFIHSVG